MAFSKSFRSPFGADVDYWIVGVWEYSRPDNVVRGQLHGYLDEARRRQGSSPAGQLAFELPLPPGTAPEAFGRAEIYEALRTYVFIGEEFAAFTDAMDA